MRLVRPCEKFEVLRFSPILFWDSFSREAFLLLILKEGVFPTDVIPILALDFWRCFWPKRRTQAVALLVQGGSEGDRNLDYSQENVSCTSDSSR